MPSTRNINYAKREIELAKSYLERNPEDVVQRERLAWWSTYLGDYATAREHAVTEKARLYLEQCETS